MAAHGGPNIKTKGLTLCIDAQNEQSQTTDLNILNPSTWAVGTGSASGFSRNGVDAENHRIIDNDPFGQKTVVWEARPEAVSGSDGGWNGSSFAIDNTKMYRFSVWVKRNSNTNGRFYLGLNGYGSTNGVYSRSSGGNSTNPYFWSNITGFTPDVWYLVVGHVWPAGSGTGSNYVDSGRYTISGGKVGNISVDYVWRTETTSARHRSYLFYATDINQRQQFVYPRVDIVDGTEPSIDDLLNNRTNKLYAFDISKQNNSSTLINGVTVVESNQKYFDFDGVDSYLDLGSDVIISPDNQGWTAEYWFNTSSASTLQHFNSAENDEFNANWLAIYNSKLAVWNRSPGYWKYGSTIIQNDTWYQAVFVCDAGGTNYRFYINGEREGGDHVNNVWNATYSSLECRYIGRYEFQGAYSRYFNGAISLVKLYDEALSDQEIKQNFAANRKRYGI